MQPQNLTLICPPQSIRWYLKAMYRGGGIFFFWFFFTIMFFFLNVFLKSIIVMSTMISDYIPSICSNLNVRQNYTNSLAQYNMPVLIVFDVLIPFKIACRLSHLEMSRYKIRTLFSLKLLVSCNWGWIMFCFLVFYYMGFYSEY